MKNKISSYILGGALVLSSLGMTSCADDFLEKDKLGEETSETYFISQEKALASLTAAYSDIKDYRFGWFNWAFGETLSDNAIYGGSDSDNSGFEPLKSFSGTPDMFQARYKWQIPYRGIGKASQTIESVEVMEDGLFDSPSLKKRIIAEARFLRAYYHFELVRGFGRIPIVDHWVRTPDDRIGQSEPKEVLEFIVAELELAEPDLPLKNEYPSDDLGRITKGAAQAFLAKASLYLERWQAAYDWADKVVKSGQYQLEPDFAKIFSMAGEHGVESIFEISFYDSPTESGATQNNGNFQTLFQLPRNITYGFGINLPTEDLYNAFMAENDLVRMNATLLTTDEVYEMELADLYKDLADANESGDQAAIAEAEAALEAGKSKLTFNRTGFYNQKMYLRPEERSVEIRNSPNNIRVMRYAEVYLILAEAAYHLPNEATARNMMNDLREKRGLPRKEAVSGTDLLNAIYTERRLELAMESDRYHDLVRTNRASKLTGWSEAKKYWPVPQAEIDNSLGEITQNPGYEGSK